MTNKVVAAIVAFVVAAYVRAADVPPQAGYGEIAARLEALVAEEMADKKLPAVSLALVDDQRVVWARGFGYADPEAKRPATADTVYRVGSVSKLFTDIGVMRLVEEGKLDIDAPVTRYLPDFRPKNPFVDSDPITLRMLMSQDRKSTRLNSSHSRASRMPSSA